MVAGNTRASGGLHRSAANLASRLPLRVIFDVFDSSVSPTILVRCPPESRHACHEMGRFSLGP
jgi:hypothetical protein